MNIILQGQHINIALFQPQIPPNTGNIARACACTGASLHLIRPLGFSIDQKAVRRAGLDYTKQKTKHKLYENSLCLLFD